MGQSLSRGIASSTSGRHRRSPRAILRRGPSTPHARRYSRADRCSRACGPRPHKDHGRRAIPKRGTRPASLHIRSHRRRTSGVPRLSLRRSSGCALALRPASRCWGVAIPFCELTIRTMATLIARALSRWAHAPSSRSARRGRRIRANMRAGRDGVQRKFPVGFDRQIATCETLIDRWHGKPRPAHQHRADHANPAGGHARKPVAGGPRGSGAPGGRDAGRSHASAG